MPNSGKQRDRRIRLGRLPGQFQRPFDIEGGVGDAQRWDAHAARMNPCE